MPVKPRGSPVRPVGVSRVAARSPTQRGPAPGAAYGSTRPARTRSHRPRAQIWRPEDLETLVRSDDLMLSVVFGTYNRKFLLQRCVESIRASVGPMIYEIIVADGGSTDGSVQWMEAQPDIRVISGGLNGAVSAFNLGYAAARGRHVALLNDDVYAISDALQLAVAKLESDDAVGQVACAWRSIANTPFRVEPIFDRWYANLGVLPKTIGDRIVKITGGIWSPCYHTYGADTELSCWIYRLGLDVFPLQNAQFEDLHARDTLRKRNDGRARSDSRLFYRRWPKGAHMLRADGPEPAVTPRELEALHADSRRTAEDLRSASPTCD